MSQFRTDPEIMARSFIQSVERYQYDGVLLDVDTVTLAHAAGVPIDFPEDQPARTTVGVQLPRIKIEIDCIARVSKF